jgi:plastocyanin
MTERPSRTLLLLPFGIAAILAACSSSTSSNNPPPAADVLIVSGASTKGFQAYSLDTFPVKLTDGGKVTWRNDDAVPHTVTDTTAAALFNKNLGPGDTASVVFTTLGNHPYKCTIHTGMRGLVVVNP